MFFSKFVAVLPALVTLSSALPTDVVSEDVTLYAYGTNITGYSVVYGNSDGLAYLISANATTDHSLLAWDIDTSGTVAWNATIGTNATSVGSFYIVNSGFEAAGFTGSTASANATTIGFSTISNQVVLISGENLLSQFWASPTSEDGVLALEWNADGTDEDGSVPVILKLTAPTS